LQAYHRDRIREFDVDSPSNLFSVLGTVAAFRSSGGRLNRGDFHAWLQENEPVLRARVEQWLPTELPPSDSQQLLDEMVEDCLDAVDSAINIDSDTVKASEEARASDDEEESDAAPETEDESPAQIDATDKLLDRLLYCGVLPRYAFPTDVATFSVFDREKSTGFKHVMKFAPSQSLPVALTQYAPGTRSR
jgi:hypothetical protein